MTLKVSPDTLKDFFCYDKSGPLIQPVRLKFASGIDLKFALTYDQMIKEDQVFASESYLDQSLRPHTIMCYNISTPEGNVNMFRLATQTVGFGISSSIALSIEVFAQCHSYTCISDICYINTFLEKIRYMYLHYR